MAGVSARDFAEFNRTLAGVVERGMGMEEALADVREQLGSAALREATTAVVQGLREGQPLADAMRRAPRAFPPEYCALVEAGVKGGQLAVILRAVAAEQTLRAKVARSAGRIAAYLLVGLVVFVTVFGVMGSVAQSMRRIYDQMQMRDLPLLTELVFSCVEHGWASGLTLLAVVAVALVSWFGIRGLFTRSRLAYWVPLAGRLQKSRELALSCTVLSLQLSAGSSLADALEAARRGARNRRFAGALDAVRRKVEEGTELSEALFYDSFFPRTLAWAVSLGEQRADVPGVLGRFGELYGSELQRNYEILLVMLTPLSILVLGNFVLLFILSMWLPTIEIQKRLAG